MESQHSKTEARPSVLSSSKNVAQLAFLETSPLRLALSHAPTIVVAVVIGLLPLITESAHLLSMATFMGIYAILAIGLNLVLGNAGQISLGQGAFFGVGAYTYAVLARSNAPFILAYAASPIAAAVAGFIVGRIALRLHGHYFALATLAFALILHRLFHNLPITGGSLGLYDIPLPTILRGESSSIADPIRFYYLVWLIVAIIAVFTANIVRMRVGRALEALRDDETAAATLGIDVAKYKTQVFVLSAAYSGIAGSLFAGYSGFISSAAFHIDRSIDILLMTVLGGMGSVFGSILGAIVWTIVPEVFRLSDSLKGFDPYRLVIFGAVVIGIVIFWPGGIAEALHSLTQRFATPKSKVNS